MYAIPRSRDCVFGGTNQLSADCTIDPAATAQIVGECSRVLEIDEPDVLAERVGLRPFRRSGVRVERAQLRDGRVLIHNYGHGGSGFTLSWGCAEAVAEMTEAKAVPSRLIGIWRLGFRSRGARSLYVSSIALKELTTSSGPLSLKKHS